MSAFSLYMPVVPINKMSSKKSFEIAEAVLYRSDALPGAQTIVSNSEGKTCRRNAY